VRTASGVDFVAAGTAHRIAVQNTGNPPQLFQPNVPVVVVGHFVPGGFASTQIIVDHSAQYIEQHPARVRAPDGSTR
jgi:cytochrome c-type biogenesis protein CcmE